MIGTEKLKQWSQKVKEWTHCNLNLHYQLLPITAGTTVGHLSIPCCLPKGAGQSSGQRGNYVYLMLCDFITNHKKKKNVGPRLQPLVVGHVYCYRAFIFQAISYYGEQSVEYSR